MVLRQPQLPPGQQLVGGSSELSSSQKGSKISINSLSKSKERINQINSK